MLDLHEGVASLFADFAPGVGDELRVNPRGRSHHAIVNPADRRHREGKPVRYALLAPNGFVKPSTKAHPWATPWQRGKAAA